MSFDDVPDPTDWLQTPLSGLTAIETALQCKVCKEVYKTPMITSCSHTFCSECIRRALGNDGKCPLCRSSDQELKLRNNWSVEEMVEAFAKARPAMLAVARGSRQERTASPKRKLQETATGTVPEPKRLRSSARISMSLREERSSDLGRREDVILLSDQEEDERDSIFELPDTDDGLVQCPLCQKRMKEAFVFSHLDNCKGPESRPPAREAPPSRAVASLRAEPPPRQALERLPALNYSMLKEPALRKKMADLGLSTSGPRVLVERRHKEWITIWNANCDSARPKKRRELFHDLDVWERTQGGQAPGASRALNSVPAVKDKDFDGSAWAAKHHASFDDLIANARRSRLEAKGKTEEGSPSAEGASAADSAAAINSAMAIERDGSVQFTRGYPASVHDNGEEQARSLVPGGVEGTVEKEEVIFNGVSHSIGLTSGLETGGRE